MNPSLPRPRLLLAAGLAVCMSPASAQHVSLGQKLKREGVITGRAGASLTMKAEGVNLVVILTGNTDVKAKKGRLGLLKEEDRGQPHGDQRAARRPRAEDRQGRERAGRDRVPLRRPR